MRGWLLSLGLLSLATQAEIYKSVDAQGRVTYSEQPPAGAVQVEQVPMADYTPDPAAQQAAQAQLEALRAYNDSRQREREEVARQRAEAEAQRRASQPTQIIIQPPAEAEPEVVYLPVYGGAHRPGYPPRPLPPGHPPVRPYPQPQPVEPQPSGGSKWPNDMHLLNPDKW